MVAVRDGGEVVEEAALTAEERVVFDALQGSPDPGLGACGHRRHRRGFTAGVAIVRSDEGRGVVDS